MADKARQKAVEALLQIHRDGGYSHIVLDNALRSGEWQEVERALFSRLVYGVVERRLTLDYFLNACTRAPLKRAHPTVQEILRVAAYQLLFMERIPVSAAVNEAVKSAKTMGQGHASGFVNGTLRTLCRRKDEIWAALPQDDAGDEVRYSCPRELIALWRESYGDEITQGILSEINSVPPSVLRINTLRTTTEEWLEEAAAKGVAAERVAGLPDAVFVIGAADRKKLDFFGEKCYYQDIASQWCVEALDPQPGERVADVCAAPGGKSFLAAQKMQDRGFVLSGDLYSAKCEEMERRAQVLGISCMETVTRDASAPCPAPMRERFDRVLCDAPCSGFGVIRRKPEIRYKDLNEAKALPELQYRILCAAADMVRPGGVLQYSTCTLHTAENERVAERFLREHPDFEPRALPIAAAFAASGEQPSWKITLFSHVHKTDGFFIAGFTKKAKNGEATG